MPAAERARAVSRTPEADGLVLFDGGCGLCTRSVRFVARRDGGRFRFAPLGGRAAAPVLAALSPSEARADTVVLIEKGCVYTRSTAALRIASRLSRPWRWLALLLLIPPSLRDRAYDALARRRYRWFGRADACRLPPAALRDRLLD